MTASVPADVRLFGNPHITKSGETVTVDTRKAIALLAYLSVTDASASRDRLCAMFWPESNQQRARSALRRTLSSLRRTIGSDAVKADRESVGVDTAHVNIDVVRFSRLVGDGSRAELRRAADLYRGDLLSGFSIRSSPEFEDWHRVESERFRREVDEVFARLARISASEGDHVAAIRLAERRLELDRLNEPAHRLAMLAEARAGRRDRAIERYREAVRILEDELGVPPLPETTRLYEEIRRGRVPETWGVETLPMPAAAVPPGDRQEAPLVGRKDELSAVLDGYRSAAYEGRLVVVRGEAGIGKSRLLREVGDHVSAAGGRAVVVRCHEGERELAYAPLAGLLRGLMEAGESDSALRGPMRAAVGALVPEVTVPGVSSQGFGEGPEGRIRFYEGITGALRELCTTARPSLIAIDDLHFADEATAEFLAYLARRISRLPAAMVVAWRPDEMPVDGALGKLADAATGSAGAVEITLRRLDDADIDRIIRHTNPSLDVTARRAVVTAGRGVPFFAVEYANAAQSGDDEAVPEGVRSLLRERLRRLGEVGVQVITAAAVLGRPFSPQLVRAVSGRAEHGLARALDEAEALSLLERSDTGGEAQYDFTSEDLRRVAYESVPAGRRRLLHRRAAEALGRSARPTAAVLGEAATHAEQAGDTGLAARLYAAAGDAARGVHANAEAREHYSAALTLGHGDTARLHEALGDLATLSGEYGRGIGELESAAAVVAGDDLARVERKLGRVYSRRGDWAVSLSFLESAFRTAGALPLRAAVKADLATVAHRAGQAQNARDHAAAAEDLAEESGHLRARAYAANIAGLLARHGGDAERSVALFGESRDLASAAGDDERVVAALNNLALAQGDLGHHEEARRLLEVAIEKCRSIGDRHREAALLSNLGDAQFALGSHDGAAESIRQSASILAEIGIDGARLIPEIWMLREW